MSRKRPTLKVVEGDVDALDREIVRLMCVGTNDEIRPLVERRLQRARLVAVEALAGEARPGSRGVGEADPEDPSIGIP